jgi:hypothetical protein
MKSKSWARSFNRSVGRSALPLVPILALAGFLLLPSAAPCRAEEGSDQHQVPADAAPPKKKEPAVKPAARKKTGPAEAAVKPKRAPEAPLSFDDDDLRKYHHDTPRAEDAGGSSEEPESEAGEEEASPEKTPAGATAPTRKPSAGPEAAGKGAGQAPPPDPLQPFKDRQAAEKFREDRIKRSREKIARIEERLKYLNDKRLAILDPYRIMPPPQTAEDKKADPGLKVKELLALVDQEIKSTEGDLDAARQELVEVEMRFAGPSQ